MLISVIENSETDESVGRTHSALVYRCYSHCRLMKKTKIDENGKWIEGQLGQNQSYIRRLSPSQVLIDSIEEEREGKVNRIGETQTAKASIISKIRKSEGCRRKRRGWES